MSQDFVTNLKNFIYKCKLIIVEPCGVWYFNYNKQACKHLNHIVTALNKEHICAQMMCVVPYE